MITSITICGSSSLLESNRAWMKLGEKFDFNFASYGDFMSPFFGAEDKAIIAVLFFEDIIRNVDDDLSNIQNRYSDFFEALRNRAKASTQPIFMCWGKVNQDDIVRTAKATNKEEQIYGWFKNRFEELRDEIDSLYFIELSKVFSPNGFNTMYSERNWYFARCRLSVEGLSALVEAIDAVLNRCFKAPSKVLVLDCDNTIWGGVVGEDGIEGLTLGQDGVGTAFVDFQKEAIKLVREGVILVLASKNNEADVWSVFEKHNAMQLTRDDIIAHRINWNEKALNIEDMANELNLSLDSFVFWDDNPVERDKVKELLPQVLTVDVPNNVFEWPTLLRNLECFAKFETTDDDRKKQQQYQDRAKFISDSKLSNNIADYLRSINLTPSSVDIDNSTISRAEQLCKKTNQYNLRTMRHSASDLLNFESQHEDFTFLVHLKDNYGDHGIVALVCLEKLDENLVFIDTFLMSCRVLGRHLESWILSEILERLSKHGYSGLVAEFIETERNHVAREFLDTYGFMPLRENLELDRKIRNSKMTLGPNVFYLEVENTKVPNIEIFEG